jgi:hypothetical protein
MLVHGDQVAHLRGSKAETDEMPKEEVWREGGGVVAGEETLAGAMISLKAQ